MQAVSEQEEFEFRRRAEHEAARSRAPASAKKKVNGWVDAAKSYAGGLQRGGAVLLDTIEQASPASLVTNALTTAANMADAFRGHPSASGPLPLASRHTNNALKSTYKPQTTGGQYAQTLGENTFNALAPGGAVRRAANVIVPALTSETAAQAAKRAGAGETGQAVARVAGGVTGGVLSSVNPRALVRQKPAPRAPTPTRDELAGQRTEAYQAVADSGHTFEPAKLQTLARNIADDLGRAQISPTRHPRAASMLEDITATAASGEPMTLNQLDQLRQVVRRDVASSRDEAEAFMGKRIIAKIDQFIAGEAEQGTPELLRARDLNTRVSKLDALDEMDEAAVDRAASTGTGANGENATRQNVVRFAKTTGNLTDAERAAARRVIRATPAHNALRQVGRLSPEGGAVPAAISIMTGSMSGGAIPAAGFVARRVSNAMTQKNVKLLRHLIATGGQEAVQEVTTQLALPRNAQLKAQLADDLAQAYAVTSSTGSMRASREGTRP